MNPEMAMVVRRTEEREALRSVIQQWNANRLDLFELSEPNDNLEFHGVMRFYFQDSGQKVATKCIRVASDATAQDVIETLIEKFRPDMRMLSIPEYALFEIHENGDERKLSMDEKPLLVQLNWHQDDREGRFLLRRLDDKTNISCNAFQQENVSGGFHRKLSKREKKQMKKQEKLSRIKNTNGKNEGDVKVAEKLYTELPETSFTRSISNPEAVMRRRRQQILEKKLQQFRSKDGGPDTGGTLKIYGESLCRDVPYKTLLLSIRDTAQQVVREMLLKYALDKEDPQNYCLVQVIGTWEGTKENKDCASFNSNSDKEYILEDDECPLAILMNHPQSQGAIMFHVRKKPADHHPRKRKKKPQQPLKLNQQHNEILEHRVLQEDLDQLPYFLELNPDGSDVHCGKRLQLEPNVTEIGSDRNQGQSQYFQLVGPNISQRHCVVAHMEGIITITPCSRESETYVNGQRIYETTILQNGSTVKFGRKHCFRFVDPRFEYHVRQRQDSIKSVHEYSYDKQSIGGSSNVTAVAETRRNSESLDAQPNLQFFSPPSVNNYETTFDVEGNVETRSTSSQGNKEDTRSQKSAGSTNRDTSSDNRLPPAMPGGYSRGGTDAILPAVLEIREETEEALLHAIVSDLDPTIPTFKLAPAYCLYLMARYRASTHYRPDFTPMERAHRLTLILAKVAAIIRAVIQERYCDVKSLAFWLANSSELLNFLKSDRHISAFSLDAQDTLADAVQISFKHLVNCIQSELSAVMPAFFLDRDDPSHDAEDSSTASVLGVLSSAMALLRRCRVNAALTIQLFSQLFHFINVWAFNRLIAPNTKYCSRLWGLRLKARLTQIEAWAERQGLELAADCHLARIVQAAHLLQAPKYSEEDLQSLGSTCFKLNSLQLRALLIKYQPTLDEPSLPHEMIDNVVRVAENLADELARSDGREVRLEEDPDLALPFLLPDDGYSCEVVRGVPQGLVEFLSPLQHAGLCRFSGQITSSGSWTVYMGANNIQGMPRSPSAMSNRSVGHVQGHQEPDIRVIKLHKSSSGMGISIVAAKGAGQDKLGIYIKSVVKGGAADADGRLQAGDQLLKVDGQSLVGITQEKAAEYLVKTGPIGTLEIAKQGAIYHGLATLLSQPSPVMTRAPKAQRPKSDIFPAAVYNAPFSFASNGNLMEDEFYYSAKGVRSMSEKDLPCRVANDGTRFRNKVWAGEIPNQYSTDSRCLNYSQTMPHKPPPMDSQAPSYYHSNASVQYQQQQQQHPMYHKHVQQQQILMQKQQQQQHPPEVNGERFYQNLSVYRNHNNVAVSNGFVQHSPDVHYNQADSRGKPFQQSFRGSQSSLQQPFHHQPGHEFADYNNQKDRPSSAYVQKDYFPQPVMSARSQSMCDVMRQGGRFSETNEACREIQHYEPPPGHSPSRVRIPAVSPGQNYPNVDGHHMLNNGQYIGKSGKVQHQIRPHGFEGGYRESPPPPPPPPTSTHPLYDMGQRSPDNRYNASVGEPPRGGYRQPSPNAKGSNNRHHAAQGTNPWEREEREKEADRRREAAKNWRDHQISELHSLGLNRNQNQEEQLRALRLEKEFERRVQEEDDEDEDEERDEGQEGTGTGCIVQDVTRLALEQEDANQNHLILSAGKDVYPKGLMGPKVNSIQPNGSIPRSTFTYNIAMEEKERLRRLKEVTMKQTEMKDVRYKQREDGVVERHSVGGDGEHSVRPNTLRLGLDGMNHTEPQQRLDTLLEQQNAPPPPERGSSYVVMSQTLRSPNLQPNRLNESSSFTGKKVSFQDPSEDEGPEEFPEKIMHDPNRFINEAESILASPKSPDTSFGTITPGVIGNQEVYKDPRQRRLAEQQNHQKQLVNKVPEKLSFKEKMKMFAMETGEGGTPPDKVKISRAQREIDNFGSPLAQSADAINANSQVL